MSTNSQRSRPRARIYAGERETDDIVQLLGKEMAIEENHQISVRDTEKEEINQRLRIEYRNRIKHIYSFF